MAPPGSTGAAAVAALGAEPWRLTGSDYEGAITAAAATQRPLPVLTGKPVPSPWAPELNHALRQRKVEVHEEDDAVLGALLGDLASAGSAERAPVWPRRA